MKWANSLAHLNLSDTLNHAQTAARTAEKYLLVQLGLSNVVFKSMQPDKFSPEQIKKDSTKWIETVKELNLWATHEEDLIEMPWKQEVHAELRRHMLVLSGIDEDQAQALSMEPSRKRQRLM